MSLIYQFKSVFLCSILRCYYNWINSELLSGAIWLPGEQSFLISMFCVKKSFIPLGKAKEGK